MGFEIHKFMLRANEEKLRKAVKLNHEYTKENASNELKHKLELLAEWSGKYPYMMGYDIKKVSLIQNDLDYNRTIGIGTFLECEKLNDIRGWLLSIMEQAIDFQKTNENLHENNTALRMENRQLKEALLQSDRKTYYKIFPKELEEALNELEALKVIKENDEN